MIYSVPFYNKTCAYNQESISEILAPSFRIVSAQICSSCADMPWTSRLPNCCWISRPSATIGSASGISTSRVIRQSFWSACRVSSPRPASVSIATEALPERMPRSSHRSRAVVYFGLFARKRITSRHVWLILCFLQTGRQKDSYALAVLEASDKNEIGFMEALLSVSLFCTVKIAQ